MEKEIEKNMLKEDCLGKYATKNQEAIRFFPYQKDIRSNYFRDIDRILYSLSYVRYVDKTQVYSFQTNDHVCKRVLHVQLVSKIARTIARALNLNEDLTEAIALGHDLGHVPFGHVGESILNEMSLKNQEGFFSHNVQSVRTLMCLENKGKGMNITLQVLDGILCHNGELVSEIYEPKKKTKESFLKEYEMCYQDKETLKKLRPMTLEGCVVRISDMIAYLGRDIEDAIRLHHLKKEDLPEKIVSVLGKDNRSIVNCIVLDIIKNSYQKPYIKMSKSVYQAILELKKYNYQHIYEKANTKEQIYQYKIMFQTVFDYSIKCLKEKKKSDIYLDYLEEMESLYLLKNTKERIVLDYIAGMTDEYFQRQYQKITKLEKKEKK